MPTYIGTQLIEAVPMTRLEYNELRGWTVPQDENPFDNGFTIRATDGHMSWLPADIFEARYKESIATEELENDLLTTKYTKVFHEDEDEMVNGAPHHFEVWNATHLVGHVDFQKGAIQEAGVNGVMNEDLIAMVITRLEHFNKTKFSCKENAVAITKLEEAMLWLRKRTMGSRRNT